MSPADAPDLVLASGSRYRAELLARLGLDFRVATPGVDESALPGEPPAELALRLARLKAHTARDGDRGAWVIGSDQVADCRGQVLGKPGTVEVARRQLMQASGQVVEFHTAVCVVGPDGFQALEKDLTRVRFRELSAVAIDRYLGREPALDCAGSFKAEGLGITLFEAIESGDPTALVGLPLIALAAMLREAGFELP